MLRGGGALILGAGLTPALPGRHQVVLGNEKRNRRDKSIKKGVLLGKFGKGVLTSNGWLIE